MDNLIGNTPLIDISNILGINDNKFYIKCEFLNPSGSIKDRIAKYILKKAIDNNEIDKDTTILCSSSGNTGISVSMLCGIYNLKCMIFTNEKCSEEKRNIIKAYGANLKIIEKDYDSYEKIAEKSIDNSYSINQYNNPLNVETYFKCSLSTILLFIFLISLFSNKFFKIG